MTNQVESNTAELNYAKGKLDMVEKKVEEVDRKVDKLGEKVDKLTDHLSLTKTFVMGAKWCLAGMATLLGLNADVILTLIRKVL
tara:strand:- start:19 stop:270 length:252 start_codon:yes stop_codon:yes gene_type:complete